MLRSNVHCTNCLRDFVVEMNIDIDGNHEIVCPLCRHTHYRVVRDGEVTEERYRSSGGYTVTTYTVTTVSFTSSATQLTNAFYMAGTAATSATSAFTAQLWNDRSDLMTG